MHNRERLEIIRDILDISMQEREGVTKSRIMFHVDLSSIQATRYLGYLIQQTFVDYDGMHHLYHTTPKGMQCRYVINNLLEMIEKRVETGMENSSTWLKPATLNM